MKPFLKQNCFRMKKLKIKIKKCMWRSTQVFSQFCLQHFSSFLIRNMIYQLHQNIHIVTSVIESGVISITGVAKLGVPTACFDATCFVEYGLDETGFAISNVTTAGVVAIIDFCTTGYTSYMIGCTSSTTGTWIQSHTSVAGLYVHS